MKAKKNNETLLKKAAHLIEEAPAEEKKDETPAPPAPEPQPQNRNKALIFYITLLFSAAFVLVLASLLVTLVQQKNSNATISQLNENASSALSHAEQLQSENRQLLEERDSMKQELEENADKIEALEAQLAAEKQNVQNLEAQLGQKTTDADQALHAYELLIAAQRALDQDLIPDFEEAMGALAELTDYLSEHGLAQYQELAGAIQTNNE